MNEFSSSAVYVRGLCRGVTSLGREAEVRRLGGAGVAAMLDAPNSRGWWPQSEVVPFVTAMHDVGGDAFVSDIGRFVVKDSISIVIQPFINVVSALGVVSPPTFFSRFNQFTLTAIRNVKFAWREAGANAGELVVEYPSPVPDYFGALWLGPIEYAYEVARRRGEPTRITATDGRFVFALAWS